jgi:hypothetical protein
MFRKRAPQRVNNGGGTCTPWNNSADGIDGANAGEGTVNEVASRTAAAAAAACVFAVAASAEDMEDNEVEEVEEAELGNEGKVDEGTDGVGMDGGVTLGGIDAGVQSAVEAVESPEVCMNLTKNQN